MPRIPQLKGKRALEVLDLTVDALAREGVYVILDNHVSRADWCCYEGDGNALWHSPAYPEQRWLADWRFMARRYKHQPAVIGADLRNELRFGATWGGQDPAFDWHAAAERGGNAILAENPNLLIFVEGIDYALDLRGIARLPVKLDVPNRLVYSAHDYPFSHKGIRTYDDYLKSGAVEMGIPPPANPRRRSGSANLEPARSRAAWTVPIQSRKASGFVTSFGFSARPIWTGAIGRSTGLSSAGILGNSAIWRTTAC